MYKYIIITSFFLFTRFVVMANNIQLGTVTETVVGTDHFLNFTISWDNSWRVSSNPRNYDAVWIFVKRRDCAGIRWQHADLADEDTAHTAGSPLFADAYTDKKGIMIYRSVDGTGNISSVNIQLKLDAPPSGTYQYKVVGIEMVHITQGAFYLGDGVSPWSFKKGDTDNPYYVNSEAAINRSAGSSDLWSTSNIDGAFMLPAEYPKGYNAFYCMKYEISQGQYADFLNTIAQDACANRYNAAFATIARYSLSGVWPVITALAPDRACNYISPEDLSAFLDWSALSPLTELEYEKACRGDSTNLPVAGECAWGGNQVTNASTITIGTDGMPDESVSDVIAPGTGLANYSLYGIGGPLRCGFAAKSATNRFEAGATYYGVMEMSGNVYELCINADSSLYGKGPSFTGNHGDGELSTTPAAGYANQGWPGQIPDDYNSQVYSFTARGGSWTNLSGDQLKISDRSVYILNSRIPTPDSKGRSYAFGGRGVSRRQ